MLPTSLNFQTALAASAAALAALAAAALVATGNAEAADVQAAPARPDIAAPRVSQTTDSVFVAPGKAATAQPLPANVKARPAQSGDAEQGPPIGGKAQKVVLPPRPLPWWEDPRPTPSTRRPQPPSTDPHAASIDSPAPGLNAPAAPAARPWP